MRERERNERERWEQWRSRRCFTAIAALPPLLPGGGLEQLEEEDVLSLAAPSPVKGT